MNSNCYSFFFGLLCHCEERCHCEARRHCEERSNPINLVIARNEAISSQSSHCEERSNPITLSLRGGYKKLGTSLPNLSLHSNF